RASLRRAHAGRRRRGAGRDPRAFARSGGCREGRPRGLLGDRGAAGALRPDRRAFRGERRRDVHAGPLRPGRDPGGRAATPCRRAGRRVRGAGREYLGLGAALGALVLGFGALTDHFLSRATFAVIASQVPAAILVAVGMTFVLILAGIDLSVGSVLGLAGAVLGAALGRLGLSLPAGLLAALLAGLLCGTLNGALSVYVRLPSFIVTLGMMEIARGAAYTVSRSQTAYLG